MLAAALLLALAGCRPAERQAPGTRPPLALLTGLPLAFGETFTLAPAPSPVLSTLQGAFRVRLVDGPEATGRGGLMLAAQPRALTAERLVALDAWVRAGGRLLLLADPRLTWPSDRPLGDRQRPPYSFADTGLLAHWGLRSEASPAGATTPVSFHLSGLTVQSDSPGRLTSTGGPCLVATDARTAGCRLGRGRALVVADADFLRFPGGAEAVVASLKALNH